MGSERLITIAEASQVLGVGEQSVYQLARKGFLHIRRLGRAAIRRDTQGVLDAEEVAALAEARREKTLDVPTLCLRTIQLSAENRQLKRRLERLEELVGYRSNAVALDEESVIGIYAAAQEDAERPVNTASAMMEWAKTCAAITSEFFEVLVAYTSDENAWRTLLTVVDKLLSGVQEETLQFDRDMLSAVAYLRTSYRNLRSALFEYLQNIHGVAHAMQLLGIPDSVHSEVLNLIDNLY